MTAENGDAVRFVWAVDPFELDLRPSPQVVEQLKSLVGPSLRKASPAFVCGVDAESLAEEQKRLDDYVHTFLKETTERPQVLHTGTPTKKDWIETLLNFAKEKQAEMIVLNSHGRDGLSRLVMGSFAAFLLEQSPIPVLFLHKTSGQELPSGKKPLHGVFATDFSDLSKKAFGRFLASFHQQLTDVTLFHAIAFPEAAVGVMGMSGVPITYPENFIKEQIQWAETQMKTWIGEFGASATPCRLRSFVDESALINSSIAIQNFLEKNPMTILGMASHSGSLGKFFLGSVTQDLVAAKKLPVWACGPKF